MTIVFGSYIGIMSNPSPKAIFSSRDINNMTLTEKVFIEEVIRPLNLAYPKLKMVMEHISTSYGVDYINSLKGNYVKGEKRA